MAENQFGYDEVVDTLKDAIELEFDVRNTIESGGKALDYVLTILKQYPRIEEAVNDFKTFREQLSDLLVEESENVVKDLSGVPNAQNSYVFQAVVGAQKQYESTDHWIRFFKGQLI